MNSFFFLRKYGVATHFYVPLERYSLTDLAAGLDWTPLTGDVTISKNGGAAANILTLPAVIAMGQGAVWDFTVSTVEMQAATIAIVVADQVPDGRQVKHAAIICETYGNTAAKHPTLPADVLKVGGVDVVLGDAEAGTGTGDVTVDHNYGEVDALRILDSEGNPADNATIRAYVKSDYDAGVVDPKPPTTSTGSDGRWVEPLMLDSDVYYLKAYDPTDKQVTTFNLTVT